MKATCAGVSIVNPLSESKMNIRYGIFLCLLALAPLVSAEVPITKIEVFVEQPLMVTGIPNTSITVFDLSRKDAVKATAPQFSKNPEVVEGVAKAWLHSADGKTYIADLKAAYTGHSKMISYGVLKVPAIVFDDGKFVIYGTTDVMQAVEDYDEYIRVHNLSSDKIVSEQK